jgi:Tyrosine-protein kinase ephrin type A/B receptor-like
MPDRIRRSLGPRLLILAALLLALAGAIFTGTASPASADAACAAGTYSNGSTCLPAAPGYYVATDGATSQTPCPPGTYQPNAGAVSCMPAGPGYFVATVASTGQTPCAPGTYQPNAGAAACIAASVDHYVPDAGSTFQLACPAGTDQPLTGQTSCVTVTSGQADALARAISASPGRIVTR